MVLWGQTPKSARQLRMLRDSNATMVVLWILKLLFVFWIVIILYHVIEWIVWYSITTNQRCQGVVIDVCRVMCVVQVETTWWNSWTLCEQNVECKMITTKWLYNRTEMLLAETKNYAPIGPNTFSFWIHYMRTQNTKTTKSMPPFQNIYKSPPRITDRS